MDKCLEVNCKCKINKHKNEINSRNLERSINNEKMEQRNKLSREINHKNIDRSIRKRDLNLKLLRRKEDRERIMCLKTETKQKQ